MHGNAKSDGVKSTIRFNNAVGSSKKAPVSNSPCRTPPRRRDLHMQKVSAEEKSLMNTLLQGKNPGVSTSSATSLTASPKTSDMDALLQGHNESITIADKPSKSISPRRTPPRSITFADEPSKSISPRSPPRNSFVGEVSDDEQKMMNALLQGKRHNGVVLQPVAKTSTRPQDHSRVDVLLPEKSGSMAEKSVKSGSLSRTPPRNRDVREVSMLDDERKIMNKLLQGGNSSISFSDSDGQISGIENSARRKIRQSQSLMPATSSDLQQTVNRSISTLIDNKERLDSRWLWITEAIANELLPYKKMLAENDDFLPDPDEVEGFEHSMDYDCLDDMRDRMLSDKRLREQEVAAFFEGLEFFDIKVKSLESQLEALKTMQRLEDDVSPKRFQSMRASSQSHAHASIVKTQPSLIGKRFSVREMSIMKHRASTKDNKEVQRLLDELAESEKKQQKLEKQLQQAGINIAEDIPYEEAKNQIESIAKRMHEIGSSDVTHEDKTEQTKLRQEYFQLEQDMEKYNTALVLTDEYLIEQEELEQKWEDDNANDNLEALKKIRRHMPVSIKVLSESDLCKNQTPNGKYLPKIMVRKFKRTNVLQLIRVDPEEILKMHPASLENFRVTGLTLTERRAMYAHLKDVGPRWKSMSSDQMTERKWVWFKMMKQNFKENLDSFQQHVKQYGPAENHEGCPLLGKQCPLKADKMIDYDGDYGFTEEAEYETPQIKKAEKEDPGAKAMREALELTRTKKADERATELKKHYKGNVLQVSLANGSCEGMDTSMDRIDFLRHKWIEARLDIKDTGTKESQQRELSAFKDALNELKLDLFRFAERSGMQLTGKKDANADEPDIRSSVELGISEELCELSISFFEEIQDRVEEMKAKDSRLLSTMSQLRELLDELHERNISSLKEMKKKRPARTRKSKSLTQITGEAKKKLQGNQLTIGDAQDERELNSGSTSLMSAIAGRGRGRDGGGRGDLMSAIAGRGRGRGRDAGRENLMTAIAARGKGSGNKGDGSGGRGDLMAAISGRGRGRGTGRGGGDLMAAIAARGAGGS